MGLFHNWIFNLVFTCSGFLVGISNPAFSQSQNAIEDSSKVTHFIAPVQLEAFVDQFTSEHMENFHVPGLIVVVVEEDKVLLSKGYGYANLEKKISVTPQTAVRAGSVSKPVTATAVIQLVEQGIMDLNAPISTYIDDINLEDKYGQASTVGQLLNHMAGYPDKIVLSHTPSIESWEPLEMVLKTDLPSRAIAPGKVMAYSSWDYALLGYTIQKALGSPYEEVIARNLFEPLGMQNSSFQQPMPEHIFEQLAVGYGYDSEEGQYQIIPHDFVRISPGVALVTTGEDMGKYMLALLNKGVSDSTGILKEESMPLILERQAAAHPYSRGRSHAFGELTLAGRKVLYHDGNGIGFSNRLVLMPEYNLGLFLSANHRSLSEQLTSSRASTFLKNLSVEIIGNFTPESIIEIPDVHPLPNAKERVNRYTGHYQIAQRSRHDFLKLEALMNNVDVKANRDGTLKIGSGNYEEVEPFVFQSKASPSFFAVFVEDDQGEVAYLAFGGTGSYQKAKWHQNAGLHMALFGLTGLLLLSMFLVWPFTRHGHWLAWIISLIDLSFLIGIGILFNGGTDLLIFFKTIPIAVQGLFVLPWLGGILTLGLFLLLVQMWKENRKLLWSKIHYTVFALASSVLLMLAIYWNLVLL